MNRVETYFKLSLSLQQSEIERKLHLILTVQITTQLETSLFQNKIDRSNHGSQSTIKNKRIKEL